GLRRIPRNCRPTQWSTTAGSSATQRIVLLAQEVCAQRVEIRGRRRRLTGRLRADRENLGGLVGRVRRHSDVPEPEFREADAIAGSRPLLAAGHRQERRGGVEPLLVGESEGLVAELGARDPQTGDEALLAVRVQRQGTANGALK